MLLTRYLQERREGIRVRIYPVSDPFCNLPPGTLKISRCFQATETELANRRTCWLMSKMAMSFRSCVYRSKACSMIEVSVLASTTRKFFWASGGSVTCYASFSGVKYRLKVTSYPNTCKQQASNGVLDPAVSWTP